MFSQLIDYSYDFQAIAWAHTAVSFVDVTIKGTKYTVSFNDKEILLAFKCILPYPESLHGGSQKLSRFCKRVVKISRVDKLH